MSFLRGEYVQQGSEKEYSYEEHLKPKHFGLNGRPLGQALLYESPANDKSNAVFTAKDGDYITHDGTYLFSLSRLFLQIGDLTEYEFAEVVFNGWKNWKVFRDMPVLRDVIQDMKEELEIRERSRAIRQVQSIASSDKAQTAMTAAKYIAEKGWEQRGAGRPSKREVERERKIHAGIQSELESDAARIKKVY